MWKNLLGGDKGKSEAGPAQDATAHAGISLAQGTLASLLSISADAAEAGKLDGAGSAVPKLRQWAQALRKEETLAPSSAKDMLAFFHKVRAGEIQGFQSALGETRTLLWSIVQRLARGVTEAQGEDALLSSQVRTLQRAAQGGSLAELKTAAQGAAEALSLTLAERRSRADNQTRTLGKEIERLHAQLELLQHELNVDALTRVHNRRALDAHLSHVVSLCTLLHRGAALVLFDVDHFKKVNDAHGHPAGDEVLRVMGRLLLEQFPRKADFVARYGGEEFCVALIGESGDEAHRRALRFLDAVRKERITLANTVLQITISGGVAQWCPGEEPTAWLARADAALYRAKETGRDRAERAPEGAATHIAGSQVLAAKAS